MSVSALAMMLLLSILLMLLLMLMMLLRCSMVCILHTSTCTSVYACDHQGGVCCWHHHLRGDGWRSCMDPGVSPRSMGRTHQDKPDRCETHPCLCVPPTSRTAATRRLIERTHIHTYGITHGESPPMCPRTVDCVYNNKIQGTKRTS